MTGPKSQISSNFIPPAFMESNRPSRSSTLMQSWLSSIKRALKSGDPVKSLTTADFGSALLWPAVGFILKSWVLNRFAYHFVRLSSTPNDGAHRPTWIEPILRLQGLPPLIPRRGHPGHARPGRDANGASLHPYR